MIISMVGLFANLLGSATKSSNLTAGSYFARQQLEEVIRKGTYWPVTAEASVGIYTTDKDSQTTFFHRVSTTVVPASSGQYKQGFWINVDVWWWSDAPGQTRTGQGKLSTSLGRLHYPPGSLR